MRKRMWAIYNQSDGYRIKSHSIFGPDRDTWDDVRECEKALHELRKTMQAVGVTKSLVIAEYKVFSPTPIPSEP